MSARKTALVTGANRGIGYEVCRQLGHEGFHVILSSRNESKGKAAAENLKGEGLSVEFLGIDVADDTSVREAAKVFQEKQGSLNVLINNAGIHYDNWQGALDANFDIVHEALEINLLGPWRMCQAFVPLIKASGGGRIVNVSSGAAALNDMGSGTPAYSASKAGLNALTIKLAHEVKESGILVNSVCPGWVRTDMGGPSAPRSVEVGARSVVWAAFLSDDGPTGGFFRDGERIEW